jgi:bifunctional DNA-binding transcriptional regulator/antitoxin component of YhaV-PrlF toxin-antitoxin module
MNKWTIIVEEDKETGELLLPFSDELLEQVGWKIGDTIEWIDNKDGTWTMRKKNEITKTD